MAKPQQSQPQVRKSVLVGGGVVIAVAVAAFLLTSVVGGSGGGPSEPAVTAPRPATATAAPDAQPSSAEEGLRPGGRDPFKPVVAAQAAPAPPSDPEPAAAEAPPAASTPAGSLIEVVSVGPDAASIRVGSELHENVKPGTKLSDDHVLEGIQDDCVLVGRGPERFRVCKGERVLK